MTTHKNILAALRHHWRGTRSWAGARQALMFTRWEIQDRVKAWREARTALSILPPTFYEDTAYEKRRRDSKRFPALNDYRDCEPTSFD